MNYKKPLFVMVGVIASFLAFGVFLTYYNEWSSRRKHAQQIEQAFNERLLPAAVFVKSFVERNHRLPSDEEMEQSGWHCGTTGAGTDVWVSIIRERPQWIDSWGIAGRDFIVETAVPDWNLFYCSWDNKRIEANWP